MYSSWFRVLLKIPHILLNAHLLLWTNNNKCFSNKNFVSFHRVERSFWQGLWHFKAITFGYINKHRVFFVCVIIFNRNLTRFCWTKSLGLKCYFLMLFSLEHVHKSRYLCVCDPGWKYISRVPSGIFFLGLETFLADFIDRQIISNKINNCY